MSSNTDLFERIRIRRSKAQEQASACPQCQWLGCDKPAPHRAPKGRNQAGYWHYCLDHVKIYNANYNYFAGMPDSAVAAFQKDALTGHRPTWSTSARKESGINAHDPLGIASEFAGSGFKAAPEPARNIRNAERKALTTLGVDITATADEIKARYKILVKKFHPDANGGGREWEDRLREIIDAYNYLRQAGLC